MRLVIGSLHVEPTWTSCVGHWELEKSLHGRGITYTHTHSHTHTHIPISVIMCCIFHSYNIRTVIVTYSLKA